MKVRFLGSGDAFGSGGRFQTCIHLHMGDARLLVDCGASSLVAMRHFGVDPQSVDTVVLSHLHGDHFGGLPFLVLDGQFKRFRTRPVVLVGPVGFEARFQALLQATYGDLILRKRPFALDVREILPGESLDLSGARVRAFAAEHMDLPDRPLCLRIESPSGPAVAFSGDTEICDELFRASDGAALLVAECTALAPPAGRHSTWRDWTSAFSRLRARRLLLSHLSDDVRRSIAELNAAVPENLRLDFADDGITVEIG